MTFDEWWEKHAPAGDSHAVMAAEAAWDAALEEAAKVCDEMAETFGAPCRGCAGAIRRLAE